MAAPFRASDDAVRLPSSIGVTLACIAQHHRAIMDLIEDLERAHRSGASLAEHDGRIGAAHDFASANARHLNALRTGDLDAVRLSDLAFIARFAPASVRQAAE